MSSDLDDRTRLPDRPTTTSSYDTYTDSGVDWLGPIPAHWEVDRLKRTVTKCKNGYWGDPPEGDETDIATVRVADFDRFSLRVPDQDFTIRSVPADKRKDRVLQPGDLLLEKSGGGEKQPVGAVMLYDLERPAVCSNFIARMPVAAGYNPSFLRYLHGALYNSGLNERAIKQSIGIQNLDADFYLKQHVPLPPPDEQRAIAAFLDRATARIDTLVEKKERLVDLLEEKRSALVSHVVTTGLDADAEMQDSGVEWLGEIPAGWETVPLKWCTRQDASISYGIVQPGDHVEDGVPFVQTTNISSGTFELDHLQRTDPDIAADYPRSKLEAGDVILGIRASIGAAYVVPEELEGANLSRGIARLATNEQICPKYLTFYLGSLQVENYWGLAQQGSTFDEVSIANVRELTVPVPPLDEQRAIADHLDETTAQIDALIERVRDGVERLREYRTALLSAAVTGEVDVREAVHV